MNTFLLICLLIGQTLMILALIRIEKEIDNMAVTQAQFDTDLAGFLGAFQNLITAVDTLIASSAPADLTAEDQQVVAAAAAAAAELNKLNPPTPVPAPA